MLYISVFKFSSICKSVSSVSFAFSGEIPSYNAVINCSWSALRCIPISAIFVDGALVDNSESIKTEDVLIDGNSTNDIGDLVLKDREVLSESGLVVVNANIDRQAKSIINKVNIVTKGFIYVKDSKEMIDEIKRISLEVINNNIQKNYVDFNSIKTDIRERLSKYFYVETECKPMIIAVIQEV